MILDKTYLGSTEIEKIYLGSNVVYEVGGSSNIILNGTFDDDTNLTLDAARFAVAGGTLNFNRTGSGGALFELSQDIVDGDEFTVTFDISNITNAGARFLMHAGATTSGELMQTYVPYLDGVGHTFNYTHSGVTRSQVLMTASTSGSGGEYSFDNFTMVKTN